MKRRHTTPDTQSIQSFQAFQDALRTPVEAVEFRSKWLGARMLDTIRITLAEGRMADRIAYQEAAVQAVEDGEATLGQIATAQVGTSIDGRQFFKK